MIAAQQFNHNHKSGDKIIASDNNSFTHSVALLVQEHAKKYRSKDYTTYSKYQTTAAWLTHCLDYIED
jgi:hypothetical protein